MHRTFIQDSSNMGSYPRRQLGRMSQGLQAQQPIIQSQLPNQMFQMQCMQPLHGGRFHLAWPPCT